MTMVKQKPENINDIIFFMSTSIELIMNLNEVNCSYTRYKLRLCRGSLHMKVVLFGPSYRNATTG